jgi:transcriptional regulator with XRE-family HTH domain
MRFRVVPMPIMRLSAKRHPLAMLRLTLGLTQKEMADLAGTATITIQSLESGKRPLKEKLAEHIAAVTGVQLYWLLGGDPRAPIVAENGEPYTRELFESNRRLLFDRKHSKQRHEAEFAFIPEALGLFLANAYSILRHGHSKHRLAWTIYKLQTAVDSVANELGTEDEIDAKIDQLTIDHPTTGKYDAAIYLINRLHGQR